MRFFSNEAKDNEDTSEKTVPEVPQQRAGSPWQHGPADSTDRPVQEPAPQPTAFGASTVGGAVAASAAAGDSRVVDGHSTDRVSDAASGVADDRTVAFDSRPGDQGQGSTDRVGAHEQWPADADADRTVTIDQDKTVPIGERTDDRGRHTDDDVVDLALEDKGTFDDPKPTADSLRADSRQADSLGADSRQADSLGADSRQADSLRADDEAARTDDKLTGADDTAAWADSDRTTGSHAEAGSLDGDRSNVETTGSDHDAIDGDHLDDRDRSTADESDADRSKVDELAAGQAAGRNVDAAIEDKGTFDDPKVVDETDNDRPATDAVAADATSTDATSTDATPVVAVPVPATPVAATPAASSASGGGISGPAPFFPTAETQALKDRWRDVQLRFVDDPKAATGEAAQLVDEAVDKLTTALREQRGSLAKGTEDTEALRVELRAYRDILDRLLGL